MCTESYKYVEAMHCVFDTPPQQHRTAFRMKEEFPLYPCPYSLWYHVTPASILTITDTERKQKYHKQGIWRPLESYIQFLNCTYFIIFSTPSSLSPLLTVPSSQFLGQVDLENKYSDQILYFYFLSNLDIPSLTPAIFLHT